MKCYTGVTLARFPSGQRGWTQDPLRKASQVRILPSPPTFSPITGISFDTSYNKPLEQLIFKQWVLSDILLPHP